MDEAGGEGIAKMGGEVTQVRDDARLGRLPSGDLVIAHDFGLALNERVIYAYCSCGWFDNVEQVADADLAWKKHLNRKDGRREDDLSPL